MLQLLAIKNDFPRKSRTQPRTIKSASGKPQNKRSKSIQVLQLKNGRIFRRNKQKRKKPL